VDYKLTHPVNIHFSRFLTFRALPVRIDGDDPVIFSGKRVNIYKGWITIENNRIISVNADWQCPECDETGKVDIGGMIRLFSMVIQPL